MHLYTIAESAAANSLGRAISMSLVAAELGTVETWAVDDGPTWTGARHFDLEIRRFSAHGAGALVDSIRQRSASEQVVVWISKGIAPLDGIARAAQRLPDVTVIADFDDAEDRAPPQCHSPEVADSGTSRSASDRCRGRRVHVLERGRG